MLLPAAGELPAPAERGVTCPLSPSISYGGCRCVPPSSATTFVVLTGTAGPSGEVAITVGTVPRRAVLVAAGLPEGSITHPDATKQGLIAVDERTELTVGGVTAILRQNRRSIGKKGRGISIRLGERDYTYLSVAPCEEELREVRWYGRTARWGRRRPASPFRPSQTQPTWRWPSFCKGRTEPA